MRVRSSELIWVRLEFSFTNDCTVRWWNWASWLSLCMSSLRKAFSSYNCLIRSWALISSSRSCSTCSLNPCIWDDLADNRSPCSLLLLGEYVACIDFGIYLQIFWRFSIFIFFFLIACSFYQSLSMKFNLIKLHFSLQGNTFGILSLAQIIKFLFFWLPAQPTHNHHFRINLHYLVHTLNSSITLLAPNVVWHQTVPAQVLHHSQNQRSSLCGLYCPSLTSPPTLTRPPTSQPGLCLQPLPPVSSSRPVHEIKLHSPRQQRNQQQIVQQRRTRLRRRQVWKGRHQSIL